MDHLAGGKYKPYKLCIIGGGPAGHSVLVRAIRLNVMDEICRGTDEEAGVCLFDSDSVERLGGGRLQDYQINSNTWANKFYTNVIENKPDNYPPESVDDTELAKLAPSTGSEPRPGSQAGIELLNVGDSEAPLTTVGSFLVDVGQAVQNHLKKYPSSCFLSANTTVTNIQRISVERPEFLSNKQQQVEQITSLSMNKNDDSHSESKSPCISVRSQTNESECTAGDAPVGIAASTSTSSDKHFPDKSIPTSMWKISTYNHITEEKRVFYSRNCVLATGGKQLVPDLGSKALNSKLISSDRVCTTEGIIEVKRLLLAQTDNSSTEGGSSCSNASSSGHAHARNKANNKKIVIVGGSHSAFSAAWMCLHKLNLDIDVHGCLDKSSIVIMHRSAIRVFYGCKKDAEMDNYEHNGQVNRITGQIHPFGGLRGDAKKLWRAIKVGKESRVRLLHAPGTSMVNRLYADAAVIVWACGYTTNSIPIHMECGAPVRFKFDKGQVDVDEKARLLTESVHIGVTMICNDSGKPVRAEECGDGDRHNSSTTALLAPNSPKPLRVKPTLPTSMKTSGEPVSNNKNSNYNNSCVSSGGNANMTMSSVPTGYVVSGLFGIGLGYGLKATLDGSGAEPDGSTGRADGVAVYLKRAATLILAAIVQDISSVYGRNAKTGLSIESWEERLDYYNDEKKKRRDNIDGDDPVTPSLEDRVRVRQAQKSSLHEPKICVTPPRSCRVDVSTENLGNASTNVPNNRSVTGAASKTNSRALTRFPSISDRGATPDCSSNSSNSSNSTSNISHALLRKSSPSVLQSRNEKRAAFNAATSGHLLSSSTNYSMAPEYQEKLSRSLNAAQLSHSVNRLSMPKCISNAENKECNGKKAIKAIKKTNSLSATTTSTDTGINTSKTNDASDVTVVSNSTSSTKSSKSTCSGASSKSKMKKKSKAKNGFKEKNKCVNIPSKEAPEEAWVDDVCRTKTVHDAMTLLQLPVTPTAQPKSSLAAAAAAVATLSSTTDVMYKPHPPQQNDQASSESKVSYIDKKNKIPSNVAASLNKVPTLLAKMKKNNNNIPNTISNTDSNPKHIYSARARNAEKASKTNNAINPMYRLDTSTSTPAHVHM